MTLPNLNFSVLSLAPRAKNIDTSLLDHAVTIQFVRGNAIMPSLSNLCLHPTAPTDMHNGKRKEGDREGPSQSDNHLGVVTADALLALTLRKVLNCTPQDVAVSEASKFLMEQGILCVGLVGKYASIQYGDLTIPLRTRSVGGPNGNDERQIELASAESPKHANGSPILYQHRKDEITFSYPPLFNAVKLQLKMEDWPSFGDVHDGTPLEESYLDVDPEKDTGLSMLFRAEETFEVKKNSKKDRWKIVVYLSVDLQSQRELIRKKLLELGAQEQPEILPCDWYAQEEFPTVPVELVTVDLTYLGRR